VKKSGNQTNGQRNTMAGIGTAHLNRRQIAAPAGGRRFSRRCASRHWNNFKAPSPPAAVFGGTPAQVNHSSAYRKIISTVLSGPIRTTFPFPRRAKEKPSNTLKMMFDLGSVGLEEVPQIPRLEPTPEAIAYAPLGDAPFTLDAARFACQPAGALLRNGLAPAHHSPASQLAGNSSWVRRTAAKNRPINGISLRAHSG
jgi:hypothetical protein